MPTLEVRCCCRPDALLGWLPVSDRLAFKGAVLRLPLKPVQPTGWGRSPWPGDDAGDALPSSQAAPAAAMAVLSVDRLGSPYGPGTGSILAVRSDDTPLDVLRRVPGFTENPGGVPRPLTQNILRSPR